MNLYQEARKIFGLKEYPNRTKLQNRALHLYFVLLADELNIAGLDVKTVLEKIRIDVPWTKDSVKNDLWRPIQVKMLDKTSTTELDTTDITTIYEAIDRAMRQRFGIAVDFPSEEQTQQFYESLIKSKL